MKKVIQIAVLLGVFHFCTEDNEFIIEELESPISMSEFCQKSPDDTLRQTDYVYSSENLIKETRKQNNIIISITSFEYNETNQLIKKTYQTFLYDSDGQMSDTSESETIFEYEYNLLVKENKSWGGWSTFDYENGKLTTKNDYTANGELHHITNYKYFGSLKVEERKETALGNIIFIKNFEYDSKGILVKIIEDDNVVEENFYDGNKLIEKRTYYFGIDPGFDICYGNYIFKYDYY